MCPTDQSSRRRFLAAFGTTAVSLAAGCQGQRSQTTTTTTTTATTSTTTTTTTTTEQNMPSEPMIDASFQTTDDRSVTVPTAYIDETGWLVIHPAKSDGRIDPSRVLGATMLETGTNENVDVTLHRMLDGSQTLYAMLHYDDPADEEFTFLESGDPPVTVDGSPVIRPFTASYTGDLTPAISVTDQETDGSSITIPAATIDASGWIVIHPEAQGGGPDGSTILGSQHLPAGTFTDRTVDLESSLSLDQTLYAMLHYDDPADGALTFPEDGDPPATAGGSVVVKPFEVTVPGGSRPTASVSAVDTGFDPMKRSVEPGTRVTWTNEDSFGHDVTSAQFHDAAAQWDFAAELSAGETATYTFTESGIYEYYCTIHGKSPMCGAILVGDVSLDDALPCEDSGDSGSDGGGDYGGSGGDGDY